MEFPLGYYPSILLAIEEQLKSDKLEG